jgi:hypothetical protein
MPGLSKEIYRAAVRQWLTVKTLPAETRRELAVQAAIWTGMLVLFLWGLLGLVVFQS